MFQPNTQEKMPNGILIILDPETGQWTLSINRFVTKIITQEIYAELLSQAKEFLREARDQGFPVVDPDDDDAIMERIPGIGDEVQHIESNSRILDGGLEEAASILPNLWGWIVGIDDEPWEPEKE